MKTLKTNLFRWLALGLTLNLYFTTKALAQADCALNAIDITNRINQIDPLNNPFDCYTENYSNAMALTSDMVNGNAVVCDNQADYKDIWFKFTVSSTTPSVWIDAYTPDNTLLDVVAALYSGVAAGTCGPGGNITGLTYVDCSDGVSPGGTRDKGFGTTPLHARIDCSNLPFGTYYYRIWDWGGGATVATTVGLCIEASAPIGVTVDGCPPGPTIALTCGQPNTNVNETYPKLSNAGTTGNANNTNLNEPVVAAGTASGQNQAGCTGGWTFPIAYANNVINNTAIYSFQINATAPCVANPVITFSNMEYGGTPGNVAQIAVLNNVCAGGVSAVMTASTNGTCIKMRPGTAVGVGGYYSLPNGTYYITVDGQDGQLIQYDLNIEIQHLGVGCTATNTQIAQPVALGASRCGPGTLTLTASGCSNGTLTWYDVPTGGASIATGSSFTTPSLSVSKAYYVCCVVGNCEGPRTLVYADINTVPTVTTNDPSICNGQSTTLTTTVSDPGGTYNWLPGNQTTSSITVSPATSTNYTVQYTLNGCTGSDVANVTVNPIPNVSSTSTAICTGGSGTLTASATPTGGSYSWAPGGQNTQSITVSPAATQQYTVTYTANGCSNTATGTVTVNNPPTASISGSNSICSGQTTPISVSLTGTAPWSITYTNGATSNTVSSIASSPYVFNTGTAGTYTLTAVNDASCSGTVSGSAVVTVATAPTFSNLAAQCDGTNSNYTVTFNISGGNPASYSVTGMNGGTISGTGPYTFTSNPILSGTQNYSFTLTDGNNCAPATISGTQDCNCPTSASISGGGTICQNSGQTANVTVNLVGNGPFSFVYSDGTSSYPVNTTLNSYVISTSTPGTYTLVSVNDANNCGGSVSGSATVTQTPQPTVSTNDPTICSGATATITVTPAVSGGTYSWMAPASVAGQTSQSVMDSPNTNTFYYFTYTLNGCSVYDSSEVTVNPTPTLTMTNDSICDGEAGTVTATPSVTGGTYQWLYPSSQSSNTTNTVTASPVADQYYVVLYNAMGCTAQDTAYMMVSPTPIVSVSPQDPSICQGTTITLTANSTLNGGTFNWSPGTFPNSTTIDVTPNTSTMYYVFQTLNGCNSNTDSTFVTVNPTPVANATSNAPICEGDALNLEGNSIAGAQYAWTGPNGFTSTQEDPSIPNAQSSQSGNYLLTITSNGCSSIPSSVNVQIQAYPNATQVAAGPYCSADGLDTLMGNTPGGTWSGTGIVNPAVGEFNPSAAGPGVHTITYSFGGLCPSSSTQDITVIETPAFNITIDPTTVCQGRPVSFQSTLTPAGAIFEWDMGDGTYNTTNLTPTYVYGAAGTYDVSFTAENNGCITTQSFPGVITVNVQPVAAFTYVQNNASFNFTNNSTGAQNYTWTMGTFSTTNEVNPVISFVGTSGDIPVTLVASTPQGCIDSVTQTLIIPEEILFFVPNTFTPDADNVNQYFVPVMTQGLDFSSYVFQVYNRFGELIFESKDASIGWDGTYKNRAVPEGVYTWRIKFTDKITDEKFTYEGNINLLR